MRNGFDGGVHPPHYKTHTEDVAIRSAREPEVVVIPLVQHLGAPCEATVKKGDVVDVGQVIGDASAFVSAPVHASVSGKVFKVEPRLHPALGKPVPAVIIESDGENRWHDSIEPRDAEDLTPEEIIRTMRTAGLVGLGGAAFPTAVKFSPPKDKPVDTFLLNGAECEPFLTADHRLMLEGTADILTGMRVMMRALGVTTGTICIEDNKPDALAAMEAACKDVPDIKVVSLKTRYPQGSEKQLIKSVLNRDVPPPPGLPMDVGVVVSNVSTAHALSRAFKTGMPLIERVVTVTGPAIAEPANLLVKIGTLFHHLIEECGGFEGNASKLIMGGPMMGIAQFSTNVPVIKGTSGILALGAEDEWDGEATACIKCGRCVDVCPMRLVPILISAYAEREWYEKAEQLYAADCLECGCCSFICPARRPLVQAIRMAKQHIMNQRRERQAAST